jgi:hypothetical protein
MSIFSHAFAFYRLGTVVEIETVAVYLAIIPSGAK